MSHEPTPPAPSTPKKGFTVSAHTLQQYGGVNPLAAELEQQMGNFFDSTKGKGDFNIIFEGIDADTDAALRTRFAAFLFRPVDVNHGPDVLNRIHFTFHTADGRSQELTAQELRYSSH